MKVRCNQCMSIFDEEYIKISEDPLYMKGEEICPICSKGGSLMDMPDEGITKSELDDLASTAEEIIKSLMDDLERLEEENLDVNNKIYTANDNILAADMWLKWFNGEGTDEEREEIKKDLLANK